MLMKTLDQVAVADKGNGVVGLIRCYNNDGPKSINGPTLDGTATH
jgi:hypothetical protein